MDLLYWPRSVSPMDFVHQNVAHKRDKGGHQDTVENINERNSVDQLACQSSGAMSFELPEFRDSTTMVFFEENSQSPAIGRYILECSDQGRPHRVLDNPMGLEGLWVAQTASHGMYVSEMMSEFDTADEHGECTLCQGARASELSPYNCVHFRCSYAVPCGRARLEPFPFLLG